MPFFLILSGALGLASDNGLVCIPKGVLSGIDEDFGVVCITNSKALLMDRTEVTQSLWQEIYSWALTNNYEFPSDVNHVGANGSNYPVHAVTFGVAVLWCNARSEKNGLAPCFINYAGTGIKKIFRANQQMLSLRFWFQASDSPRVGICGKRLNLHTISLGKRNLIFKRKLHRMDKLLRGVDGCRSCSSSFCKRQEFECSWGCGNKPRDEFPAKSIWPV